MDIISGARSLRQQLVALDSSDKNIEELAVKLDELGKDHLKADLADNHFQKLRLSLQLSVCEGIQNVYEQYSNKKWVQVQQTAHSIKSFLEADTVTSMTSLMTSSAGTRPDRAAAVWSASDCEFYRRD